MSTITTILGSKGQGKTAIATYVAYETFKAKEKDIIIANYKLNFDFMKMDFERLEEYKDALIIFDEAHLYVDRRTSMKKLNRLISYFVFEIRHLHSDLIFISQQRSIDTRIENATDAFFFPEMWVWGGEKYRKKIDDDEKADLIRIKEIDTAHNRSKIFHLDLRKLDYDLFSLYDSDELVSFNFDTS
jgi:Zonular occludens toxin (Zot).